MWIRVNDRQPLHPGTYRVRRFGPRKAVVEDEMEYNGKDWVTYSGRPTSSVLTWWEGGTA